MKHTKLKIYIYLEGGVRHEAKRYSINCNSVYGIGVSICQFRCMPCGRKENCLFQGSKVNQAQKQAFYLEEPISYKNLTIY